MEYFDSDSGREGTEAEEPQAAGIPEGGGRAEARPPKPRPKRKAPSGGPKMSIADLQAIFSSAREVHEGDAERIAELFEEGDTAYLMEGRRIIAVMMLPAAYDKMRRG